MTNAEVRMPTPRLIPTFRVSTTSSSVSSGGMREMYSQFNILSIYILLKNDLDHKKDVTAALQNQPP
jgi:hypothetical protein